MALGIPIKYVLRIDTGDLVRSVSICGSSSRLDYYPLLEIGVYEFDAKTQVVVGTHNFVEAVPVFQPCIFPDDARVIVFGMNGGKTIEICTAGTPEFQSNT